MFRKARLVPVLVILFCLAGCTVSTQEGERRDFDSPMPETISFHFETEYNQGIVWGRSLLILGVALWLVKSASPSGRFVAILAAGLPGLGLAGWLFYGGMGIVNDYRIDVTTENLRISVPPDNAKEFEWQKIKGMFIAGKRYSAAEGAIQYKHYEKMELLLADGQKYPVDLSRLSVEQRGTLWQAIARRAQLSSQR